MKCPQCEKEMDPENGTCPHGSSGAKPNPVLTFIRKLDAILAVMCLSAMILVVLYQIVARNLFHTGMEGADVFVRHMVLWVVFFGASIATREDRHINIDLLPRFLSSKRERLAGLLVSVFSVGVAGVLSYASFEFVRLEMESGITLMPLGVPIWVAESIIPIGYATIAFHFAVNGFVSFRVKKGHEKQNVHT